MRRVLLCVRGGAGELPAVASALRDRGAEPVAIDPSMFPSGVPVTLAYERAGFRGRWGAELVEPGSISAIWQSLVVGTELPAMEPDTRQTCVAASELAVIGLLESLQAFQVDPQWNKALAENKPHQLRVAQRVGLEIPETIVTNDPAAVRAFAARSGPVIAKMLIQPAGAVGEEADVVFTTAMTPADLAELDGLELCPMIFQERIENRRDVRATIVGKRVFAAALDGAGGGGEVDWRRESYAQDRAPVWARHELPAEIVERLLRLADHFGLNYAAADFVVRPDGRHTFLELNASGSFAFLGAEHAAPIASAIAEVLVDPSARRIVSPS